jgi:hypothetical protein
VPALVRLYSTLVSIVSILNNVVLDGLLEVFVVLRARAPVPRGLIWLFLNLEGDILPI